MEKILKAFTLIHEFDLPQRQGFPRFGRQRFFCFFSGGPSGEL